MFPQSILELLRSRGDEPVVEHGVRVVSAAQLLDKVGRVAAGLRAAGIGPGSGLAVVTDVTADGLAAMIAGYVVGARVAGVRAGMPAEQVAHVLRDGIAAVVVDATTADPAMRAARVSVLPVDELALVEPRGLVVDGRPDDIARVVFTSGSTGNPKGCVQTYAALSADSTYDTALWTDGEREVAAGMARHLLFGTLSSMVVVDYAVRCLFSGGVLVIPDGMPSFHETLARLRITSSIMTVPRLYQTVAAVRDGLVKLDELRMLMVSGSPLDPARLAEGLEILGPVIFHGYGQSELGLISLLTPREALASPGALASVGKPLPRTSIEIRDGEVFARTPYRAIGYRDDPEEQAEVFVDGWVRTRDLGHLDEEGYLHLSGRTRDVVIVNANVHYTGPIERLLASDSLVDQAYVLGVPDERTGEAVHAFVLPRGSAVPDPGELAERVRVAFGLDVTVHVIDEVPLGATGKADKRALSARLA